MNYVQNESKSEYTYLCSSMISFEIRSTVPTFFSSDRPMQPQQEKINFDT